MAKEKMVCVEWEDASYNSGYYDKLTPEDFTPVFTRTVGHFVEKTKEGVLVSVDRFYDDKGKITNERHISTVPKKMIRRLIYLKEE